MAADWEKRAAEKRARIDKSIPLEWRIQHLPIRNNVINFPAECGLLSAEELKITNSSATHLVKLLAGGELKSVDVTLAFCKRAALAHQLVNCALEFFPEKALAQAKELDEYLEKHKKPVGPLHGLPISLKDQFRVKDLETSMGYVSWIGNYETDESVMVDLLRKAGAVFYIKTNVPQTLMTGETFNNIIGRTVNPYNRNLSPGGSSGGEGALIGIRGSVLGVGTDIGGSIRIPSAYSYIYGIRPSHGRMPYAKMANTLAGQETAPSVTGPMAHSISDLKLFMSSILAQEPWKYDSKVVPIPWRDSEVDIIKRKITAGGLTLGFYSNDGIVLPHPPIVRGVETVVSALKKNGHDLVEWKPYNHLEAVRMMDEIFSLDGGVDLINDIEASGEPVNPNILDPYSLNRNGTTMTRLWELQLQKWKYQCDYLEKWREVEQKMGKELDAIISPVMATAAVRHNKLRYYGYTLVFNLLDLPCVVVPVMFANKNIDCARGNYEPMNDEDAEVQAEYDPEVYHGAPVAIQVIGRRLSEERTLAIAGEISRLLGASAASYL